ncbi:MAG: helix-turn-helix transcriptional regulator [Actinomycetia bacterium]|nr:helix-turn-helix transcriptional regulator [Actinomycetes bacterium]MCP4224605.1 helix-turn-helix transcriptional regulator [Actinomycetes bacterium]MCP5034425.1 helix-turn-helix transcriptional regulator [Actinomycetes bacterium]
MTSYGQYCPIAKATEVLGERWTMLVVRELLLGSRRFGDIARGLPTMSRTMLTKRLRQLEVGGILDRLDGEYHLTEAGQELRPLVFGLGEWGAKWLLEEPLAEECDAEILMWWAHARLDTAPLPDRRTILHFVLRDDRRQFWVVVEDVGCSICMHDPGFDIDAVINTDSLTLHRIWFEFETPRDALRAGRLSFDGPSAITRRLTQVLTIAPASLMGVDDDSPRPRMRESQAMKSTR